MTTFSRTTTQYNEDPAYQHLVDDAFARAEPSIVEFANKHLLRLERWYHDTPTWILAGEADGLKRNIYIGPTTDMDSLGLSVAVLAYQDNDFKRKLLRPGIVIGQVRVAALKKAPHQVAILLSKAYEKVMGIRAEDLS